MCFFIYIFLFEYKADNTILNTIYDTILTALLLIMFQYNATGYVTYYTINYVTYNTMYLLTEWEGRTGEYLARGHDVRTECSEVCVS